MTYQGDRGRSLSITSLLFALAYTAVPAPAALRPVAPRETINLNGRWQVEQGNMDTRPHIFAHTVPVPGLLDMAQPPFEEIGKKSHLRRAFWYRRVFRLDRAIPEV